MTMRILAIDLATTTGCAFGSPMSKPESWTVDFHRWKNHDQRMAQVLRWVRHLHEKLAPDLIAVEAPIGGPDASHLLIGMTFCVRGQAADLGIRTVMYSSSTIRHHFIGKSLTSRHFPGMKRSDVQLAIKNRVRDKCLSLGWEPKTLDESDALAAFDYACARESMPHQVQTVGGLFRKQA